MKILVTGHDGYLGQVMLPFLREAGHTTTGLDTGFYARCQFQSPPTTDALCRDIRDVSAKELEGFDAVVFLAALSNDALGDLDPTLTDEINRDATVRFAREAKAAGVRRFVFSSSCSLYGAQGDAPLTETAALNPVTPYGRTKIEVERELSKLCDESFVTTYMRNATVYGVSPNLRIDLVVNNLTAYAHTTGEVLLKSDGSPWRPLVHVEDVARAFLAVLEADADTVSDQAFNVGVNEENYRIRDVARIVSEVVPDARVELAADASPDLRNYRVSFDKITAALPAFQPVWTVRKGVEELLAAYREHGLTEEEFRSSRYLRIATILELKKAGRLNERLRWAG
ncbi:MAG: NAD(P)-dependent oxidoreductase [bacterium]|nr:NAD(P)-dependent oxidoreductase [bacterium]